MKRTGFKRLTYVEALEKNKKKFVIKKGKTKKKTSVSYPTILGIKGRRYVGIKGCLWTIFSEYIRKRDFVKYGGKCVSCEKILERWQDGDPGHYLSVARGNFETLFDEKNVHLQCKRCNNPEWTPDASIPFRYELDRRLGKGTADDIFERSKKTGSGYSEIEYMREIERYKLKSSKIII